MGCCCLKKPQITHLSKIVEEKDIEKEEEEEEEEEEIKEEVKEEIREEVKEEVKEEPKIEEEEIFSFKLNFEKARKIVKLCLENDNLYRKFIDDISSFNDAQFTNLFEGNLDYNKYPEFIGIEKIEFKFLLMKFEDYNIILYEWYEDESKYENIIKLWNSKLCLCKLKENSDDELRQILIDLGINNDLDNFMDDLRTVLSSISKESKSSNIKNYLIIQYKDFDNLIKANYTYKKEVKKSNIKDKNDIENVLSNLGGELAKFDK